MFTREVRHNDSQYNDILHTSKTCGAQHKDTEFWVSATFLINMLSVAVSHDVSVPVQVVAVTVETTYLTKA
jgi:hypothetical protein